MSRKNDLKRNPTKSKVNVVSKASLALLNPAYAMGIEYGYHLEDTSASSRQSPKQSHANRTPELAAFTLPETHQDESDAWERGFGVMTPVDMQRKTSNNSVFEDDEQIRQSPHESSQNSGSSSSSRSLSRLFTRKRSNSKASTVGNKTPVTISSPVWDVPSSAPAHVTTFDQAGYAFSQKPHSHKIESNSTPTSPVDIFAVPLPPSSTTPVISNSSSRQTMLKLRNTLARKSSMPSLRDVRRITATPSTVQVRTQQAKSILWGDGYNQTEMLALAAARSQKQASNGVPAHARLPSASKTTARLVSSVGKGVRKSSYDNSMSPSSSNTSIVLTPELEEEMNSPEINVAPAPQRKVPRKKVKQFQVTNAPPLPSLEQMMNVPKTQKSERRRSKSVDAILSPTLFSELPSLVTPEGLFDTSIEDEDQENVPPAQDENSYDGAIPQQAQKVNLSNRPTVVGISSPKLVNFSPRLPDSSPRSPLASLYSPNNSQDRASRRRSNRNSGATIMGVPRLEAPVVVNVMPPTPDLGADEYATFNGEIPSPGVRRSLEMSDVYFPGATEAVTQKDGDKPNNESVHMDSVSALDAIAKAHAAADGNNTHARTQSTISDLSDFSTSAASESGTSTTDEPFGFSRSLSTMSLLSNSTDAESDRDGSDSSDEEGGSVESAQIMCISPSTSFTRAQFVSPKVASLASPRVPNKAPLLAEGSTSTFSSIASMHSKSNSIQSSTSSKSNRDSQRFADSLASLSSGQSLASVMTANTSVDHSQDGNSLSLLKKATQKRISSDLSAPAEIQYMLDSFGVDAQADEDDCDTPRLSDNAFGIQQSSPAPMASSVFPGTRPLNVRKTSSTMNNSTESPPNLANASPNKDSPVRVSPNQISPSGGQNLTPGYSPTPMRPYPRAQNSSSPHLELDLSLPLDLHGIGLGFDVEEDKPKKRGGKSGKHNSKRDSHRPKIPTKSRARQSVDLNAPVNVHPKTPPSSGKLLASAMEHDSAMGLGLDFGLEGFKTVEDHGFTNNNEDCSVGDALGLTFEEHTLLSNAAQRSSNQRVSILRSSAAGKSLRSVASNDTLHAPRRPGTGDSTCSSSTLRASAFDGADQRQHGDIGFAL
ncbi:uncharacterized protein FA14DRAFT_181687 [Meira miltonrushii]|uniref:Uncharacterized protein n=1 Tax=Meira miltonrushii TaxID=1280837 RepID=A0A316VA19_9BASI|nr:uncharacterized protein FA14DRAFT_181687 [Meira miltonrushii]PWN33023.1 hypothetical protein FA14DRAFT_181687 [Meira miltonrushii]